jgi:hypothetical protein
VTRALRRARSDPALQREILSLYAHALCIEDATVNVLLRGRPALFERVWASGQLLAWDLQSMQDYADLVHTTTYACLDRLTCADLRARIDISDARRLDTMQVLNLFVLYEIPMICGELAAKGRAPARARTARRELPSRVVASGNRHADTTSVLHQSVPDVSMRTIPPRAGA